MIHDFRQRQQHYHQQQNRISRSLFPHTVDQDGLAVLAVEYIGNVNRVAVACADGYLTVWEIDTYKMLSYTRLKDVQVGLRFCPAMNVLTSWGVDDFNHEILVWDVDTLKILHVLDGHCEPIKDICEVAPPPSSKIIDGKKKNWEPMLGGS